MNYIAAAAILVGLLLPSSAHSTQQAAMTPPAPVLDAALRAPCACESTGIATGTPTQYDPSGNVLHGEINHHDVGMCQINNDWNGAQASAMGMDIYTEAGNIRFANYLYETRGLEPWHWSKPCWGE